MPKTTSRSRRPVARDRQTLATALMRAREKAENDYRLLRVQMYQAEQAGRVPDLTNNPEAHQAWTAAEVVAAEARAERSARRVERLEVQLATAAA